MRNISLIIFLALSGCVAVEEYKFSGGEKFSEITIESSMPNWDVDTYISTSEESCEGFKSFGALFYDAELRSGGLFGAIQKINPLRRDEQISITQRVPNQSVIQVKVYAHFYLANMNGSCGPITTKIRTGKGGKYKLHVGKSGKKCTLTAIDLSTGETIGEKILCR